MPGWAAHGRRRQDRGTLRLEGVQGHVRILAASRGRGGLGYHALRPLEVRVSHPNSFHTVHHHRRSRSSGELFRAHAHLAQGRMQRILLWKAVTQTCRALTAIRLPPPAGAPSILICLAAVTLRDAMALTRLAASEVRPAMAVDFFAETSRSKS